MIKPTFTEFIQAVVQHYHANPGWRVGQAYFNVLATMRPEMAEQIRGGVLDPFYQDSRIPVFLEFVSEHWGEVGDRRGRMRHWV